MLAINADEAQRKRATIKERLKDERRNGKNIEQWRAKWRKGARRKRKVRK